MKTVIRTMSLLAILGALGITSAFAQQKKYLVVKYETRPVSPKIMSIIEEKMNDPKAYAEMVNQVAKSRYYYTLMVDLKNQKSVFYLDSVSIDEHIRPVGHSLFSIQQKDGSIISGEEMAAEEYTIQGNTSTLKWEIGKESTKIQNYTAMKAVLSNSSDVEVWFTPDINTQFAPSFYQGLSGLILKIETFYDETNATKISYSDDDTAFSKLEELAKAKTSGKEVAFGKYLDNRTTFVQMMVQQLSKK